MRNETDLYEEVLQREKELQEDDIVIETHHLTLAGQCKNIMPLLKSIYKQTNPEAEKATEKGTRLYINSNKPIGGGEIISEIDLKQNVRNKNMKTYYHDQKVIGGLNRRNSDQIAGMNIETYNEDDPEVQILK